MDEKQVECYVKAGKIAKQVRENARSYVKKGMKLLEVAEKIEGEIKELGGEWAFPVNLSLNEIAAHYTPTADDETVAEGLLKIDLGVSFNGCIADCAFSLDLSEDGRYKDIIEMNEKVLEKAIGVLDSDSVVGDIGTEIEKNVSGFKIVRNLSGHSLGENQIHSGLTIPNYKNDHPIDA